MKTGPTTWLDLGPAQQHGSVRKGVRTGVPVVLVEQRPKSSSEKRARQRDRDGQGKFARKVQMPEMLA